MASIAISGSAHLRLAVAVQAPTHIEAMLHRDDIHLLHLAMAVDAIKLGLALFVFGVQMR